MNEDGTPFRSVLESIFDINKVITIPTKITKTTTKVDIIELEIPENLLAIKMVAIDIKKGNLPLQGTNAFVSIAISLSLGEFIIRHPTTPAALQPNPMHMVIICFPEEQHFLKMPSTLKAILGKYPKSSKIVKRGKKIAMGGSITEIIHVSV